MADPGKVQQPQAENENDHHVDNRFDRRSHRDVGVDEPQDDAYNDEHDEKAWIRSMRQDGAGEGPL